MHRIEKQKATQLQVGKWTVIPLENCVVQGDQKTVIIPKVMDLLLYFSNHVDQVLSIQQLSDAIWPNEFVGDNAIYNLIGQLRKALGDNVSKPVYIETLSKKGYRLIAEVTEVAQASFADTSINLPNKSDTLSLKTNITKWIVMTIGVFITAYLVSLILPSSEVTKADMSLAEQQYSLGQFHLNKGQADNIKKAINYFQQSLTIEPNYVHAMLDLGFAYLQLSQIQDSGVSTYKNKAMQLAKKMTGLRTNNSNVSALMQLTLAKNERELSHQHWLENYDGANLSHRSLIAFSKAYFHEGRIDDVIKLQNKALTRCANCAYIYNALATSQLIKGDLASAFTNFQLSLELNDSQANNPIRELGYSNLTLSKLKATSKWIKTSGIEHDLIDPKQRNPLALFYLSLRQPQKAQQLMQPALHKIDNGFFTLYTLAALYGAQQNHLQSHVFFEKRMTLYPENDRFIMSMAYSFWISGKTDEALTLLQQTILVNNDITLLQHNTDIGLILLYGALLLENGQQGKGRQVLTTLAKRFEQGLVGSSDQAYLGYAQTLALLNENKLALKEIETALTNGWVEDFNNNWWYLENDPFFKGLRDMDQFKNLIAQHHKTISKLNAD
jgi:DNA-binding winged helix-turn-helix (wHTH) protein/Tfp pilus assembly protein PilF